MQDNSNTLPSAFVPPHVLCHLPFDSAVLVGFSGGADSTALLHMLTLYSKSTGAKIFALHVNHGIRGEEADRDEKFCRQTAERLGVEFFSVRIDIPSISAERGESIETAARNERYRIFSEYMISENIPILATAHNADDNLETMLFNLARGTGLGGLCGIPSSRKCEGGYTVRPILGLEKSEIIEYCRQNSLEFVTDSTNLETEYTRNKIRNRILPVMREINDGAVKNAYRASMMFREDESCLKSLATRFCEELGESREIDTEKLVSSPSAVVGRVLSAIYTDMCGGTLECTHIEALRRLAERNIPHSRISLPRGIVGVIDNSKLMLLHETALPHTVETEDYSLPLFEGKNFISQINCEIFIKTTQYAKNIYKTATLLSFDFAKINGELTARSRRDGDSIRIGGMKKSLKKLMNERKIPLALRSRLPIICDGDEIVGVPYIGICDKARIRTDSTEGIELEIRLH